MPDAVLGCEQLRALLSVPGALPVLAASLLARVPVGMVPFALVLTVRHGRVLLVRAWRVRTAARTRGRPTGAQVVLLPVALLFATALMVEGLLPLAGPPVGGRFVGVVASGALFPPVAATLRAAWPRFASMCAGR